MENNATLSAQPLGLVGVGQQGQGRVWQFLGNAFLAPKIKFLLKFLVIVVREIWLLVPNLVRRKWLLVPNLVREIWLLEPNLVRQIWLLVPNVVREMWLLVPNLVREKVTLQ